VITQKFNVYFYELRGYTNNSEFSCCGG